ncbi:MAG: hypothetical protein KDD11_21335 [Acidobacteria bacterium]|nr:hypothetical protein [Acidobacteriota bacterium]
MAELICRRDLYVLDQAAEAALAQFGNITSKRTLTRRYTERQRELEEHAMERFLYAAADAISELGVGAFSHSMIVQYWRPILRKAENLASLDPAFKALALKHAPLSLQKLQRRRSELALHLWQIDELLELFRLAGIEPPSQSKAP